MTYGKFILVGALRGVPAVVELINEPNMKIDQELAELTPERDTMITIGVFDGVHRGHRHLIAQLIREATDTGRLAGVVTFRNHPASILRADFVPQYLTSLDERIHLLKELGVDFVIPITFDLALSKLPARDFVIQLRKRLRIRGLVVGPDFAMGHKRDGDMKALAALGKEMDFSITVVDVLSDNGDAVRSTAIRRALVEGDVSLVANMLGHNFFQTGIVVKGEARGRTLGFPTANLEVSPGMAIPANGIYATWACIGRERHMAATSIGTRPTFQESQRTIEAFLLDFDGNLYDQEMRLEYVQRLREELKYDTVEALLEQIHKDVDQTRAILKADRSQV